MKAIRHFFCLVALAVSLSVAGQQTAFHTNDLVDFNRALELYNNQQYRAAQLLFEKVKEQVDDEKIEGDCAYYIANAAIRLRQNGADALMEEFVERYPTNTKRNAAFLDVADYYFDAGNYSLARKWYEQVDQDKLTRREKERFNFNYGYANFKNRNPEIAQRHLERVKDSDRYGSQATYYLGFMAYEGDDFSQAQELFEEVETDERFNENLAYFQSEMNFRQGNFEKAIELGLEQLPTANRQEISELNKIIGESYFNLGRYQEAIPYLKEYRGERGRWSNTDYYQLGYAYYQQGDYESAITEFNKIIGGDNAVAQNAYYHLAQSYLNADQKQQALNAFKNASEMDFDQRIQADAALNYAKLSYEIGNSYQSVPQVLMDYLENYPNSPAEREIRELLINSFITTRNYEEALRLLEGNRDFENSVIYQQVALYRGMEQFEAGDYAGAKKSFEQSLSQPRNDRFTALATFWKAEADFQLRNYREAVVGYRDFQGMRGAAGAKERENLDYNLGYAYFKQRDYARAATHFGRFVENPNADPVRRTDAYIRMGDSHFVESNYWPAMEAYNQAVAANSAASDYAAFQKAISYGFVGRNESKIQDLSNFVSRYSRSPYRDDALYELGNTYVAMNQNQQGLQAYDRLLREHSNSSLVPKALLKQGLVHYNADRGNEALQKLKRVAAEFPSSPEAGQAVQTARLIYIDLGRTDEYASWVQGLDFIEVTDADLDNTTYEAAENQYVQNNTARAKEGFEKYLSSFPNGIHALSSHFYLGQIYFQEGNLQASIPHYQYVADREKSEFSERALERLSRAYLENRNYAAAIPVLKRLETEADDQQNVLFAQSNLMKSYLEEENFDQAEAYAQKVMNNSLGGARVKNDAQVIIARTAIARGNNSRARQAYAEIEQTATGELAAEALYYNAYFKFEDGDHQASNEVIQRLASEYSGYKRYGAKGLVLMAKNFYALNDAYQATYILENVIDNFPNYPEVTEEARQELQRIRAQEARTNSSIETNN